MEKLFFVTIPVLILFNGPLIQFVNRFFIPYSGSVFGNTLIADSQTIGPLVYSAFLGWFLGVYIGIILKRVIFYEDEKTIEHLLKTYHFTNGFLCVPLFLAILIDGGILLPIANYQATHDIFISLGVALVGFMMAFSPFMSPTGMHLFSFFSVNRYFDKIRIMRCLFKERKQLTKQQLTNKIENKDRIDKYLSSLLKACMIKQKGKKYKLSEQTLSMS